MEELEKNLLMNELFDIYGELLSSTQQKMIHLYYHLDLSLAEISTQEGVSRNAVYDALKKGFEILKNYENKLHLREKKILFNEKLETLKDVLDKDTYKIVLTAIKED